MKIVFAIGILACWLGLMTTVTEGVSFKRLFENPWLTRFLSRGQNRHNNWWFSWKFQKSDADRTVPELITENGYPVESHEVTTDDGYILTVHRIPYGRNEGINSDLMRPVVFLQHGFLASSADWILNTVKKSLAYMLADRGFDVWMGNARGNTYSRKHVNMTDAEFKYWNFSFHEMGVHDIPSVIDYILKETGKNKLTYIGHSMGTTMFWVAMSERPEYNNKIQQMIGLAPVAYVKYIRSPIRILAPLSYEAELAAKYFGDREFLPHRGVISILRKIICDFKPLEDAICENIVFLLSGFDQKQLNETMLPVILGHTPAGTSTHTLLHFAQGIMSGKFQQFDYGASDNKKIYGTKNPPRYKLLNVQAPVHLFWGQNDLLASKTDISHLVEQLPNMKSLQKVAYPSFSHLDFLFAIDANVLVYKYVIELLN